MARPTKKEHHKATMRLPAVRVTADQRISVDNRAATVGMSTSDYIRTLALTTTAPKRKTKMASSLLVELNRVGVELSRQGNNLNQLAHGLHSDRLPNPQTLEAVIADNQATLSELMSLMEKLDSSL